MSRLYSARAILVLTAVLAVAAPGPAQDAPNQATSAVAEKSSRDTSWLVDTIRGNTGAFSHVSVARDAIWDLTFIVYYDALNGDLLWARTVSSGGNCGPGNTWLCESLYTSSNDVGLYNSIDIYNNPGGVYVLISFYDKTNERLMYIKGLVLLEGDTFTKVIYQLDAGFNDPEDRTGVYTAVRYDDNHNPWIAYQNETYDSMFGTHYMMAEWVGDGSGNCGSGAHAADWNCYDLFSNGLSQTFSSTGLTIDPLNRPVVAYYDPNSGDVLAARRVGSGSGGCGPGGDWECFSVRGRLGDLDTGKHVVPFTGDGFMSLFYQNVTDGTLDRATYLGPVAASNCGSNSTGAGLGYEWLCETIGSMENTDSKRPISVAADRNGFPIVTHQFNAGIGPLVLNVARPVASPGVSAAGNCGPGNEWYCETIDGGTNQSLADSVSLVVDDQGAGYLAYHEWDSYNFRYNLNLATINEFIFSNGFEGGDTSWWSAEVP